MSSNQFGYQRNLSCKHGNFVLNECIHFYHSKNHKVEVAQLDAEKAFDTLWRVGLYHKLINVIDDVYFRSLVSYYADSKIIVKYNNENSNQNKRRRETRRRSVWLPFQFFYG